MIAWTDPVAAAIVILGVGAMLLLARRRGRGLARTLIAVVVIGCTMIGVVAALGVPAYRAGRDSLLVPEGAISKSANAAKSGAFEMLGYVITDNDNATTAVDAQGSSLTTVAATGGLVNPDGTLGYVGVQNALIHAHMAGSRGELVLQNYDPSAGTGGDFTPELAHAALATQATQDAFAGQVAEVVRREHWEGVVVDFEQVASADQPGLVTLLGSLRRQLPNASRINVAVPVPQPDNPSSMTYNLAAIGAAADTVNLMTYDQSDPTSSAGPIGSLPWIKASVANVTKSIPANKLQLGVAGYGYAWGPSAAKIGESFSPDTARKAVAADNSRPVWDATAAEWKATLHDGTTLRWDDEASMAARVDLARKLGLEGAAIWDLSTADSVTAIASKIPMLRAPIDKATGRPVSLVNAKGLVALTFDDGPDPTWTPQILDILARENVPGTFFDIGRKAEDSPDLVLQEVNSGNVVGSHTYSHKDLTQMPQWRARLEIAAAGWVIHGITGRQPTLFRSPYGAAELADSQSAAHKDLAATLGLQPVGWNVDPLDWSQPGVDQIVSNTVNAPGNDLTVLLHDGGGDRSQTVAALPKIIEGLKARGYQFTTVDKLDGSLTAPYEAPPRTWSGDLKAVVMIASYRLWMSAHSVVVWILLVLGFISLFRIIVSWPLAVAHRRRARKRPTPDLTDGHELTVSVLIPAHNEEATIRKTLNSLMSLRGPVTEIHISENGSTDGTAKVVNDFIAQHGDSRFQLHEFGGVGKARALNLALAQTKASVIVVVDADSVVDPDFVERILPHFANSKVGAVAGNVKVGNRGRLLAKLQSLEYIVSLALDRRAQSHLGVVSVVPGAAGAFRRDALVRIGGWPARTLVEDTDLTVSLLGAGWEIPYEPRAISWTEAPETAADVLKQRRRWAFGSTEVAALNARRILDRRHGRLGMVGLPWLVLAQVVLPAAGPVVDLFIIWLLLNADWGAALGMLALSLGGEILVATWALKTEGESLRQLWLVPMARFIWRPLMLLSVVGSLRTWLIGGSVTWRKITRRNTVAHNYQLNLDNDNLTPT